MKIRFLITLVCCLVLEVSCSPRQSDKKQITLTDDFYAPLTPNDIISLMDLTIEAVMDVFPDRTFSIQPLFYNQLTKEILNRDLRKVLSTDGNHISFGEDELKQFEIDNECLKGKKLKGFVPDSKRQYVADSLSDINIVLSPPLVDRKEKIVCVFTHVVYKYKDGYASDDIYYFFELTPDEKSWYLSLSKKPI